MNLLHITTSPRGERSRSNQAGIAFLDTWRAAHPEAKITTRDLANEAPSFVSSAWFEGAFTAPDGHSPAAKTAMAESDYNVDQLLVADEILITLPMFNLSIPAALKAWIDQIVRVGRTFTMDDSGNYQGLVPNKRVNVIIATGGDFRPDTPAFGYNFLEPYLRAILGFVGLTDVHIAYVPNQSTKSAEQGLTDGLDAAKALAA